MKVNMRELIGANAWVALDVPNMEEAESILSVLTGLDGIGVKVGLELITAVGLPAIMSAIPTLPVFVDLKFKDIPNTVRGAAKAAASWQPAIFNVHASGGIEMMRAACEVRGQSAVFAVSVLTSFDEKACQSSYGRTVSGAVVNFAWMALEAGCQGLICSAQDLDYFAGYHRLRDDLLKLTPGVRPAWAPAKGDQKRVTTPREAILAGADGVVVGRPITRPPDRISVAEAASRILEEVEAALKERG